MENFTHHVPFYVVTGGVATTGHSSELTAGQVGLIDRQTWSVATAAGNGKEFFFAQGSIGGFDWYGAPIKDTHKSPFFFSKDVKNIYKSLPARIQNEEWVVGYDGSASSKGLSFEAGKSTKIKFYFYGDPIYRKFAGPKEYVISYSPDEDCVDAVCDTSCGPVALDSRPHTMKMIDRINTHPELKNFGVTAKLKTNLFVAATATMDKWSLSVCDEGNAISLQAVQAQYPLAIITRTSRAGSISTYQFCRLKTAGTPAAFSQTAPVSFATCSVCPVGSTLTAGYNIYYVNRPLAGSEDLSTANLRQTYANTIATAYATVRTFDGATAVDPTTDQITSTAHGFVTGQRVRYSNGGGTTIVGLTNNTDYFVIRIDANNVDLATTFANAIAGTAVDITADGVGAAHTLTTQSTATFLQQDGATAKVQLTTSAGQTLTAILSDTLELNYTEGAFCTFATPSTIAWSDVGDGISSSRVLKTKLARPDCNASGDRTAELTSLLSAFTDITIGTLTKIAGLGCVDEYTVTQLSNDCLDEACLASNATFNYNTIPSLDGAVWEVISEARFSGVSDPSAKSGIVITAGYIDPQFGNCSFNVFDYYNDEPVRMEVSVFDEDASNCQYKNLATVFQSRKGVIGRQSGEYVVREVLMKTNAYLKHMDQFSPDPRMREAFDQNLLSMVDRKAYYILYYVTFNASYNTMDRKNEQEKFTTVFAVKESDQAQFNLESGPLAILQAKSGVALRINS
jgi:hypothetical protein